MSICATAGTINEAPAENLFSPEGRRLMKITSDAWRLMEKFIRGEYVGPELHREARSDAVLRATDPEHWRVLIPETPSELINEENFTYSLPLDLPAPPRLRMRE